MEPVLPSLGAKGNEYRHTGTVQRTARSMVQQYMDKAALVVEEISPCISNRCIRRAFKLLDRRCAQE